MYWHKNVAVKSARLKRKIWQGWNTDWYWDWQKNDIKLRLGYRPRYEHS